MHIWIVALLAGCTGEDTLPEADAAPPAPPADHHLAAEEMRTAVAQGDIREARAVAATAYEALGEPVGDTEATKHWRSARAAIKTVQEAPDLAVASAAVGTLAGECGMCHLSRGIDAGEPVPPPPPRGTTMKEAVAHHEWASIALWIGITRPHAPTVSIVAREVSEHGFIGSRVEDSPLPPEATEFERGVHEHAGALLRSDVPDQWEEPYGELIGTCAKCHKLWRDVNR